MMGYGGGGWLWFLVFAALVIIPFWKLLPRYGIPAPVALVSVIPLGALILLWVVAFKEPDSSQENGA